MPDISIIVPCYNGQAYIKPLLEGLRGQTADCLEIILVDDGSTDKSGHIMDDMAAQDSRFRVIHQPNTGLSGARNAGLATARGRYIMFPDADDSLEPDMAEKLLAAAQSHDAQLVICGYYMELHNSRGCIWRKPYALPGGLVLTSPEEIKAHLLPLMEASLFYNAWNKLYDRELIQERGLRFADVPVGEDWDFNLRYMQGCRRLAVIEDCCYHYIRERRQALSTGFRPDWFQLKKAEYERISLRFAALGLQSPAGRDFLRRWYVERVLGCIDNEFCADNPAGAAEKYRRVREMVRDGLTREACRVRPGSFMTGLMILPLRMGWARLSCLLGRLTAFTRRRFPALFYQLKSSR